MTDYWREQIEMPPIVEFVQECIVYEDGRQTIVVTALVRNADSTVYILPPLIS